MSTLNQIPEEIHPDSFHGSMVPLLILGQICGLVPLQGISGSGLRFSWTNGIHGYAAIIFLVTLFFDSCYTVDNFKVGIRIDVFGLKSPLPLFKDFGGGLRRKVNCKVAYYWASEVFIMKDYTMNSTKSSTVFYTVCLLTTIFFLQIAKELPEISKKFTEVEAQMSDYGFPKRLGVKIKIFLFSFIFFGIIEHGTLVFMSVRSAWANSSEGEESFGRLFYIYHFPALTKRLSYSGLGTIILFWVNAMCTLNWNYLDFFIIVLSMETYSRFSLINSKLKSKNLATESEMFWTKITQDYNRLSLLTKELDKKLSKVILTSFFSNMYHLSLQLVRSLKINGTVFQKTYFYFSLSYLVVRLLLVLFFAAKVNTESKKPTEDLLSIDQPCREAMRFCHQVYTDDIAFTGSRFFVLNQSFVVSIIGTILTYQGVLLQFNSLKEGND